MIFLVPKDYIHDDKLQLSCEKYSFAEVVYWDDLLENLRTDDISEANALLKEIIGYFENKILDTKIELVLNAAEAAIMFNTRDLLEAHDLFAKLYQIIKKAEPIILEKLGADYRPSDWAELPDDAELGKYLNYKDEPVVFHGLCFRLLEQNPTASDFVLSASIQADHVPELEDKMMKRNDVLLYNDWLYIKLDKYILTDKEAVQSYSNAVANVIAQLLA